MTAPESNKVPIKRHENLKPLSRDHHHGLLLCWKIRTGLAKKISIQRISGYVKYFYREELEPHFRLEENQIFTLLPEDHPMVKRALEEHAELRKILREEELQEQELLTLVKKLNKHIRFEERELFQEIQKTTPQQILEELHVADHSFTRDDFHDQFWL